MDYEDSREYAATLDASDPLGNFREKFNFPANRNGYAPVYLCSNSLGLQPVRAAEYVCAELDRWATRAVDGHFTGDRPWLSYPRLATEGFAELAGAKSQEVVAMNTLTVNLHVLMASFYRPTAKRYKILIEEKAFPSDEYAVASQVQLAGFDPSDSVVHWPSANENGYLDIETLQDLLDREGDSIALMLLPGVQYYTGQRLDMERICELGRRAGCRVGLDLAHAFGNVELRLHDWAPDFAVWCTYKYGNAGPGAIAGAFVHESNHLADQLLALQGWWGNAEATRFEMRPNFTPADGAERWQMSTPPLLSLAPVVASMELFLEAGFERLRQKSTTLTGYLAWLIEHRFSDIIDIITPEEQRGAQLSLIVRDKNINARELYNTLRELNATGDWREPNVIRIAPAPFYNSYEDVLEFADRLQHALDHHAVNVDHTL